MMSEYESYVSPENKETTGTQAYVAAEIEQAVSSITEISTSEVRSGHLAPTQSATSTSTTPTFAIFRPPQQAKILQTFNDFPLELRRKIEGYHVKRSTMAIKEKMNDVQ